MGYQGRSPWLVSSVFPPIDSVVKRPAVAAALALRRRPTSNSSLIYVGRTGVGFPADATLDATFHPARQKQNRPAAEKFGVPDGIWTRVYAVKGRRPNNNLHETGRAVTLYKKSHASAPCLVGHRLLTRKNLVS